MGQVEVRTSCEVTGLEPGLGKFICREENRLKRRSCVLPSRPIKPPRKRFTPI